MAVSTEADFEALWNYNDPAGTEAQFLAVRQSLGAAEDYARLMELDTQIARAQGLQGRFADALNMLETVQVALRPDETRAAIRYELEFGRVLRSSGSPEAARPFFERAVALAEAAGGRPPHGRPGRAGSGAASLADAGRPRICSRLGRSGRPQMARHAVEQY